MTIPLSNAHLPTIDSENLAKSEIERLKFIVEFINKSPFGTCSLTMIVKNFNSSFNVSKTVCRDSWILDYGTQII